MDDLVERVARALVPHLCGSQEDQHGRDLPDKQYDDLPPDWQDAHRRYAQATIDASGITRLTAERDAALADAERLRLELREMTPHTPEEVEVFQTCFERGLLDLEQAIEGTRDERIERARAALASWQERAA